MSRVLLSRTGEIVCMFVFRCPSASELKRQDSKRVRTVCLFPPLIVIWLAERMSAREQMF